MNFHCSQNVFWCHLLKNNSWYSTFILGRVVVNNDQHIVIFWLFSNWLNLWVVYLDYLPCELLTAYRTRVFLPLRSAGFLWFGHLEVSAILVRSSWHQLLQLYLPGTAFVIITPSLWFSCCRWSNSFLVRLFLGTVFITFFNF